MIEADYGITEMAHANGPNARFNGDDKLLVKFFRRPRRDEEKSREQGRPIYVETDYIQIMQPGNKDSIVERPARSADKQRFARHWQAYESRTGSETMEGTPLEEWPAISRSQVEELKFFNVHTLEQLVGMSDSNAQGIMGINLLKERAKKFLEVAEDSAAAEQLLEQQRENEQLRATLAEMQARLEALEEEEEEA